MSHHDTSEAEVSITEAARNFSEYVNRVAYLQESFSLVRGKKPVARLVPATPVSRNSRDGWLTLSMAVTSETDPAAWLADLQRLRSSL
ncbi:MAG: type II toxin-antitoxin system Phd/YefM family antitoxin [Candidatus Methylacidiphilales bacterium]